MRRDRFRVVGVALLLAAAAPGCSADTGKGANGDDGTNGGGGGNGGGPPPRSCPAPVTQPCTAEGWCNEYPGLLHSIQSISALAPDDAWMSGPGGLAIHVQCDRWTIASIPTYANLQRVHVAAADAIWFFGALGSAARFDGADYTEVLFDDPPWESHGWWAVSGVSRDDFFASNRGGLLRWNGTRFEKALTAFGSATSLAMSRRDSGWALGSDLYYYDGHGFRRVPDPAVSRIFLLDIAAVAPDDVWLIAAEDRLIHWNGKQFETSPAPIAGARRLSWNGQGELFLQAEKGVMRRANGAWVRALDEQGRDIVAPAWRDDRSPGGNWLFADSGPVHWNGHAFERLVEHAPISIREVWMTGAGEFWALPGGFVPTPNEVIRHDANGYSRVKLDGEFNVLTGTSPTDLWVAGTRAYHWNGTRFNETPLPAAGPVTSLWAGANEAWAAHGDEQLLHWDGAKWTLVPTGSGLALSQVWASGAGDVWALGLNGEGIGKVLRADGGGSFQEVPRTAVMDQESEWVMSGLGRDEVWLTAQIPWGEFGGRIVYRYSAGRFVQVRDSGDSVVSAGAQRVAGRPGDAWLLGDSPYHWNGTKLEWLMLPLDWGQSIDAMSGARPDDLWFAGRGGAMFHWNGTAMTREHAATADSLIALSTAFGAPVAVGAEGTIVRRGRRP